MTKNWCQKTLKSKDLAIDLFIILILKPFFCCLKKIRIRKGLCKMINEFTYIILMKSFKTSFESF